MGIFDDVITNAKSAAQAVGKVAGQFVDMSKLRLNLAELNAEINKQYQALGQFVYESRKAGNIDETGLAEKYAALDELYAQFSAVSAQLASLQNKVTCPACGKQGDTDSMFCSHCGMKLSDVQVPVEEPVAEEAPVEEAPACDVCTCEEPVVEEAPAEAAAEE